MHTPTYQKSSDTDWAVLFIHGFMGSPKQFTDLAEAVYESGCTYRALLLPGHGGGMRNFLKFGLRDWQACVQDEIDKLKREHKKIFLVGHSMGGLLALQASLLRENNIAGLVLIATPLKVYLLNPKRLLQRLGIIRLPKSSKMKSIYVDSNSITVPISLLYSFAIRPAIHFYRLLRQTKKRLPDIFVPVCMFHSKNDETTSYKSAALLYEGLCNTERRSFSLDKSWHVFFEDDERAFIRVNMLAFIQEIGADPS